MTLPLPGNDVASAIQLALAPVFLLTGIAGMLNVMTGRLSRIVDRGRTLTEIDSDDPAHAAELRTLEVRRGLVSVAITACTTASLALCVVIATLFASALLGVRLDWIVGLMFTAATLALVVGLTWFLREVWMASTSIRLRTRPGPAPRG